MMRTIPACIKGTEKSTRSTRSGLMVISDIAMSADPLYTHSELRI